MTEKRKKEAENGAEACSEPVTEKALKPKAKIEKKFLHNNLTKINKLNGIGQVQRKKKKKKKKHVPVRDLEKSSCEKENENKLKLSEVKQKSVASEEHNEKRRQEHKTNKKPGSLQKKQQSQKDDKKRSGLEKNLNHMNRGKHTELEKDEQRAKKKEKLGGLIFMCSAKTKPDCFQYRVMGVPISKKDLVLGVKPGLKLFLYDFELRLMYGVYNASSSGGVKLEPTAFSGAFPVQVRFTVYEDCYPLPESVFRKAIKENYNGNNKFETELSVKQVKKLRELFQPVAVLSKTPAIRTQPIATIQNRDFAEGAREFWHHREPFARDSHQHNELRRYSLLPHESDQYLPYRDVPSSEKEEFRQDTFLSEKEYRTYGLRRERPNLTPSTSHVAPAVEYCPRGHVREDHMRNPSAMYRDFAPPPGEPNHHGPLLLNEREYQDYGVDARLELQHSIPSMRVATTILGSNPGHQNYSSYLYLPPSRRDEVPSGSYFLNRSRETYPSETDHLQTRETYPTELEHLSRRGNYLTEPDILKRREDDAERLYSAQASTALSNYNRTRDYPGARPETPRAPVSSRYSFAGPSLSYH